MERLISFFYPLYCPWKEIWFICPESESGKIYLTIFSGSCFFLCRKWMRAVGTISIYLISILNECKHEIKTPVDCFDFLAYICIHFSHSKSRNSQLFGTILSSVKTNDKIVALTFDDGPNSLYTDSILAILDSADIKSYILPCWKRNRITSGRIEKIISHGHEIGNHSYSHTRMILKSYGFVEDEIEHTNSPIWKSGYSAEITFRPPYGKKLFYFLTSWCERKSILSCGTSNRILSTHMWRLMPEEWQSMGANNWTWFNSIDARVAGIKNTFAGCVATHHSGA